MRTLAMLAAAVSIAGAALAQEAPTPTPAPAAATRPFTLNLDRILLGDDQTGHQEFNVSLRREIWNDPMVRLSFALGREEAAARRAGTFGVPAPFVAGPLLPPMPGPDLRLVLKGPWSEDWDELTTGEKVGRVTETAVTYAIIFEILRSLR